MKVKIYIDWEYREVITSKEQKDKIMQCYIEENEDNRIIHTQEYLDAYNISAIEVLFMTDDERIELVQKIKNYIKDLAQDEFDNRYEEIEVEI